MSYARFSEDSDVYVYLSVVGERAVIDCCACSLEHGECFLASSTVEMVRHLISHIAHGDRVPVQAMGSLENDTEIVERWIAAKASGRRWRFALVSQEMALNGVGWGG